MPPVGQRSRVGFIPLLAVVASHTAFLGLLLLAVAPVAAPADEVSTNASAPASYGYPIADPLLATVLGTPPALRAAVPDAIDVERRSLTLFPDREIPRVLWSSKKFEYSFVAQREPAPLIFLIAGTGARFDSEKNAYLQKVLYQAGMSVVNISSPTHPDFIITASRLVRTRLHEGRRRGPLHRK